MARNMNRNVRIATSDPMEDTKIIPIFEGCNILIATPRRLWEFVYDRKWDEFKNVRLVTSNKRPEYRSSTKSHSGSNPTGSGVAMAEERGSVAAQAKSIPQVETLLATPNEHIAISNLMYEMH